MNLEQIDTSTTAGKAEVMRLAAEGRRVAVRLRGRPDEFSECKSPSWCWDTYIYAVITDPVGPSELFVVMRGDGVASAVCETLDRANSWMWSGTEVVRYIRADLAGEKD